MLTRIPCAYIFILSVVFSLLGCKLQESWGLCLFPAVSSVPVTASGTEQIVTAYLVKKWIRWSNSLLLDDYLLGFFEDGILLAVWFSSRTVPWSGGKEKTHLFNDFIMIIELLMCFPVALNLPADLCCCRRGSGRRTRRRLRLSRLPEPHVGPDRPVFPIGQGLLHPARIRGGNNSFSLRIIILASCNRRAVFLLSGRFYLKHSEIYSLNRTIDWNERTFAFRTYLKRFCIAVSCVQIPLCTDVYALGVSSDHHLVSCVDTAHPSICVPQVTSLLSTWPQTHR